MKINKPFRSDVKGKKYSVYVKNKEGNVKKINFGAKGYGDYTQHRDKTRRKSFRARHRCDPVSKLNKSTPRYWACQYLWND
jgi:hypothetical protein